MVRGLYFLLTPVDPSILRKVNCLLLGAISLPSCILTTQVRSQVKYYFNITNHTFLSRGYIDKNIYSKLSFSVTSDIFCVSVPAWLWGRNALCHHWLQFWSHRCRKAASLQGADETQPKRDVMTFSTQQQFITLYVVGWCFALNRFASAFECTELKSLDHCQDLRLQDRQQPSCFWTSSSVLLTMSYNLLLYIHLMALWRSLFSVTWTTLSYIVVKFLVLCRKTRTRQILNKKQLLFRCCIFLLFKCFFKMQTDGSSWYLCHMQGFQY